MTTKPYLYRRMKLGIRSAFILLVAGVGAACSAIPLLNDDSNDRLIAATPHDLAETVLYRFASSRADSFELVYPFERGREMVRFAVNRDLAREPGIAHVAWTAGDKAALVLSGHVDFGNSGDETTYAEAFSGLYEAERQAGGWRLSRQIALDSLVNIAAQHLDVTLHPGRGMEVIDTLGVAVNTPFGFAARLNHAARIKKVVLDSVPAKYEFGGGLLWADAKQHDDAHLLLEYDLDVARDSATNANSGRFEDAFGHVRNQYYWHPRGAGWYDFDLTVRAPRDVLVATDLPQVDTVAGSERVVKAHSRNPTFALSLVYDRDWKPVVRRIGTVQLAVYATPDFEPDPDSAASAFARAYDLLSERFGEPASDYFVIAQQRTRPGAGWLWRSNEMIGAAANGGSMIRRESPPRAPFGHEIAHGWVNATGPASNFLGEGWAMLAESILLEDAYGPDILSDFWEHRRNLYLIQSFEGRTSVLEDAENSGIAYTKGAWILRMLQAFVGEESFARGMREYMQIPPGRPAGIDEFAAEMSRAAGIDVWSFLKPWLEEKNIPEMTVHVEDDRVIVVQEGPLFELHVDLELVTSGGSVRRVLHVDEREEVLDLSGIGPVHDVRIDPEHRLLLRRDRGEWVRFELSAPAAEEVKLYGDFHAEPFPAASADGIWSVTVPLSEGRYLYYWEVDGEEMEGGAREVEPVEHLEVHYPR